MDELAREQPNRRVAANWDRAGCGLWRGGEGRGGDLSKWRAHDSTYYGLRWRFRKPRQRGNAFATHPLCLKARMISVTTTPQN